MDGVLYVYSQCDRSVLYLSLQAHLVTLHILSDCSLLHQLTPHLIHLLYKMNRSQTNEKG